MKNVITFDEYLEQVYLEGQAAAVIDDDYADKRDEWIANLDNEQIIEYADEYGELRDMQASKQHESDN